MGPYPQIPALWIYFCIYMMEFWLTPSIAILPWLCSHFIYFLYPHKHSAQFSCSVVSDSLWPHESQHARPPCPSPTPRVYSNSCPSSWWCHQAISSSVIPSPPAPNPSQHQGLFQWVNSSHEVAKVLEFQLQHQSLYMKKHATNWFLNINKNKSVQRIIINNRIMFAYSKFIECVL